jgi:aubergine-like protein
MRRNSRDVEKSFNEFMIGKIVMTRYNNLCYKIDDVAWKMSPESTFDRRGTPVGSPFITLYL